MPNVAVAYNLITFAITDKSDPYHGMTAFIMGKGMPGLAVGGKYDKMSQR